MAEIKTTKIKIRKQDRATGTSIDVMVNGLRSTLAVDQEVDVPEHVIEALSNSSIQFDVVGGDGGVSPSSTAPLTDTATRAEPNIDPLASADGDGEPREVPELGTDNGAPGVGGAVAVAVEPEARLAAANAEGQGSGAGSKPETDTASRGAGDEKANDEVEPGPLDHSIPDLTAHLETVSDAGEIDKLIKAEKGDKSRSGALAALEARKAALAE